MVFKSLAMTAASFVMLTGAAQAATSVTIGSPYGGGYNPVVPAVQAVTSAATNQAVQSASGSSSAQNSATQQKMSNIVNNQGAAYGQPAQGQASPRYVYRKLDPNDPLAITPIPDRLYHNDEPHVYYNDTCVCVTGY